MKGGDIILVPLPQADGQNKPRPAVLLCKLPPFGDFLVCGVSTQLRLQVADFDDTITKVDDDFSKSGLRQDSLIRLGFLAVFPLDQIIGSIGEISPVRRRRLLERLAGYLVSDRNLP
jgi:mRNA interferase MazF